MKQYGEFKNVIEFKKHFKNGLTPKRQSSRKKIVHTSFLLLLSIIFSSCATIISGTKQKMTVTGNINSPVELLVDGKSYSNVKLPAKIKIKRKSETSKIVAFAPNYKLEKQELDKTLNHLVWTDVSGTVLFPVFMYVDWCTGANKKTTQNKIALKFAQINSEKEVFNTYIDFGTEYYNTDLLDEALFYFRQAYEIDSLSGVALEKINSIYNRLDYLEEQARLKAERGEMWSNILMLVGVGLQTTANVMSTVQANNSSNSNVGENNNNSKGGCNCANIQSQYTRNAQKARSAAGTSGYARGKEIVGAISGGQYGDNSAGNATVKSSANQLVRTCEQEMARLERENAKCGCPPLR